MLSSSLALLKRSKTPHLHKYLEGVPTPQNLIDHVAGASLHYTTPIHLSGAKRGADKLSLFLFNSGVARYIEYKGANSSSARNHHKNNREERLSALFFHHVLYPAGGARRPLQAVVVRGGRLVRPSAVALVAVESTGAADRSVASQAARDPLAVPAEFDPTLAGASSTSAQQPQQQQLSLNSSGISAAAIRRLVEAGGAEHGLASSDEYEAHWSRSDPARSPFFYPTPLQRNNTEYMHHLNGSGGGGNDGGDVYGGLGRLESSRPGALMGRPHFSVYHSHTNTQVFNMQREKQKMMRREGEAGQQDTNSNKNNGDVVLAPLCRVIADAVAAQLSSEKTGVSLAGNSGGLLLFGKHKEVPFSDALASRKPNTESPLSIPAAVKKAAVENGASYYCLQTRLPSEALPTITVTAGNSGAGEKVTLCRLAGGMEPFVNFAVGTPLRPRAEGASDGSGKDHCFAHISCLVRVDLSPGEQEEHKDATRQQQSQQGERDNRARVEGTQDKALSRPPTVAPAPRSAGTEGRTLGVSVDPPKSIVAQDITEKGNRIYYPSPISNSNTSSSSSSAEGEGEGKEERGEVLLGRQDCETYLLPQKELMIDIVVSSSITELCTESNKQRLRHVTSANANLTTTTVSGNGDSSSSSSSAKEQEEFYEKGKASAAKLMKSKFEQLRAKKEQKEHENAIQQQQKTVSTSENREISGGSSSANRITERESYTIRALPGDVVFIPRGCGYRLRRIAGTVYQKEAVPSDDSATAAGRESAKRRYLNDYYEGRHHTYGSVGEGQRNASSSSNSNAGGGGGPAKVVSLSDPHLSARNPTATAIATTTTTAAPAVAATLARTNKSAGQRGGGKETRERVSVDALLIHYAPYPVLSKAQASVYVAANYVRGGIEDFYEKGGNSVFHKYE